MKRIKIRKSDANRISPVAFSVCLYIALMMVQTPVMQIGRIAAISTIGLVITACLFSGKRPFRYFRVSYCSGALIFFCVLLFLTTFAQQHQYTEMFEVVAMIVAAIFLCGITISQKDDDAIRRILELAITVYAILAIHSCVKNIDTRYYHGDIALFGTVFDPNYIGIPFVAGTVLMMDNILNRRHLCVSVICYGMIAVAIVFTASRGNMITWTFSNLLVLYYHFRRRGIFWGKKLILGFTAVILLIYLVRFFAAEFETQWQRMTGFGKGSDNGRFDLWLTSLSLWIKRPVFGIGYQGVYHASGAGSHNTYIQILTETGLIGFGCMAIFLYHLLSRTYREDRMRFCLLMGMVLQIAFLDALGSRCVWAILSWFILKRKKRR